MHVPDPHPDPPFDLHLRPLPIRVMTSSWMRIHQRRLGPIYFGRSGDGRFDAPVGQYGTLYVAADAHGAFIETLGHTTGRTAIDWDEIEARALAELTVLRPLRLVDLTEEGLAHIGADGRLTAGSYAVSQPWALALYENPISQMACSIVRATINLGYVLPSSTTPRMPWPQSTWGPWPIHQTLGSWPTSSTHTGSV